jgi:hypothetical protein
MCVDGRANYGHPAILRSSGGRLPLALVAIASSVVAGALAYERLLQGTEDVTGKRDLLRHLCLAPVIWIGGGVRAMRRCSSMLMAGDAGTLRSILAHRHLIVRFSPTSRPLLGHFWLVRG